APSGRKVVQDGHLVAGRQQRVGDMRPDEAAPPVTSARRPVIGGPARGARWHSRSAAPRTWPAGRQGILADTWARTPGAMPPSRTLMSVADAPHGVTRVTWATPPSSSPAPPAPGAGSRSDTWSPGTNPCPEPAARITLLPGVASCGCA